MEPKHLRDYLDEFAFRRNRRNADGFARIAARFVESAVTRQPLTMRGLVKTTEPFRPIEPPQSGASQPELRGQAWIDVLDPMSGRIRPGPLKKIRIP